MTGEAPQPGRTPREEGNSRALTEPEPTWWHGADETEPPGVTRDDVPARSTSVSGHAGPDGQEDGPDGSRLATAGELMIIEPGGPGAVPVPEETDDSRNRPTVAFSPQRPPAARLEAPPQPAPAALAPPAQAPPTPLPDVEVSPAVEARLERLEKSPFWLSEAERTALEAAHPVDRRPGQRRRPPAHNPAAALLSMIVLGLIAAFFGWVSAEPFWLAVGHGDHGYATTTHCEGNGLSQRCIGEFATEDGRFAVSPVTLLGVSGESRAGGAISPARMVSPGSTQAYTAAAGTLMHLRWMLGFALVLACGYGIARATGANRLESGMRRRRAVLLSFAAPVLLLGGFLIGAY